MSAEHHQLAKNNFFNRKLVIGIILTFVGIFLLFDNVGILPERIKDILFSWQMLLISIGLISLASYRGSVSGILFIIIGVFFLLPKFFNFDFNFIQLFWPVLLIVLGLTLIIKRNEHFHHHPYCAVKQPKFNEQNDFVDEINIFGGSKQNVVSKNFKGGKITCIFGGSELDFRNATLSEGENTLELICFFGGVSLIIPPDWKIKSEMIALLGGFADKRHQLPELEQNNKILKIKGIAFFGGGEIKSFN